jgi:hypothetical protein
MSDDTVWYRADYWGLALGQEATLASDRHDGGLYVYAISDLQAARAYAALRENQQNMRRSVYRVVRWLSSITKLIVMATMTTPNR